MDLSTNPSPDLTPSESPDRSARPAAVPPLWADSKEISWNADELMRPDGRAAFSVLELPKEGVWPLGQVIIKPSSLTYRLPPEVEAHRLDFVREREGQLAKSYAAALARWESQGGVEDRAERPAKSIFHDGDLARVSAAEGDAFTATDDFGRQVLVLQLGRTKYSEYVATRSLDREQYAPETMAMPLAICGVVLVPDMNGKQHLLYTVRTTRTESYQGFMHVIGGVFQWGDSFKLGPSKAWIKECAEESGVEEPDISSIGVLGLVMDEHWPHPELTHVSCLSTPLEELFERRNGCAMVPKRLTDKEVLLRAIPWQEDQVAALLLGEACPGGDMDTRPWVPTGWINVALAGRQSFGQDWYDNTVLRYHDKLGWLTR